MAEQSKEKQANEQAKAQNLFARWRKEETLYSEDEKKENKDSNEDESK
ncbi:hypothetical protein WL278_01845 [Staphylococcus caprae]|uniref:Uncharacterized protein n=1 Tax=Staphylococcus caprae TaxID=29380 RepID=A0ABM7FSJ1_9STAP|nr:MULTISPECIES: hypothetical protein [Staphylococcus]EES39906.1 hypothetical protein HMPREF0793_2392 [Staphylococcus caprae M23864:W1]MBN6825794.1 hypothetical protein [Staphylococcus caprae]MBU5270747.1 hypothetical protein [Staphylococcus caprae]MBX5315775.1 hypothetical protein [Staphylococcus caprae]MBX5322899.1 hypothetical protein [Staphylococcus caprae]